MNRKVLAYIIAFPALLLLFIFKVFPAISTLLISIKNYTPVRGISGSPSAGMENYSMVFQTPLFLRLIRNTLFLNTLSILLTGIFALIFIICISRIPSKWWKLGAIAVLAIPAFMPITSFVGVFMKALSNGGIVNDILVSLGGEPVLFFGNLALYPLLFAIMDSMRNVFVPVIIGVLLCEKGTGTDFNKIFISLIGYIAVRVTMFMSPDVETILISYNPLVYENADVLDSFAYRSGLLEAKYSFSSAVWVIKTIVQLLLSVAVFFVLTAIIPRITESVDQLRDKINKPVDSIAGIIGYILLAMGSIAIILLTFIPSPAGLIEGMKILFANKNFMVSIVNSLLYCIFGCIVYGFVTVMLAYPLTTKSKLYPFILVIIMSITNNFVGEYILYRSMDMINTVFPVVLSSGISIIGAFALHFCISSRFRDGTPGFEKYLNAALLPLVTIIALMFIANWGGYLYQMLFINRSSSFGIGQLGMQLMLRQQGSMSEYITPETQDNIKSAFAFLSSIIPVSLGVILIFLSKYLPLSAFAAHIRKG